jgi:hypothetical protein
MEMCAVVWHIVVAVSTGTEVFSWAAWLHRRNLAALWPIERTHRIFDRVPKAAGRQQRKHLLGLSELRDAIALSSSLVLSGRNGKPRFCSGSELWRHSVAQYHKSVAVQLTLLFVCERMAGYRTRGLHSRCCVTA